MAFPPEAKTNLDQAPQPATPEELKDFKDLVLAKVRAAELAVKYKDPITEEDKTAAKWVLGDSVEVHAEVGAPHEPDFVDILVDENLGRVKGIDTLIRKHFRYFPTSGISEYDEELAEYYNGKRLIGEEIQRAMEQMPEVSEKQIDEAKRLAIEHARDFGDRYKGSAIPALDKNSLDEVLAILAQCTPANEASPPSFV